MPTLLRQSRFVIRIFTSDHPPPHVHVYKGGQTVKILIGDAETPPEIVTRSGMSVPDQIKAVRIVEANQDELLDGWRSMHG